jgi:hypothetical protein
LYPQYHTVTFGTCLYISCAFTEDGDDESQQFVQAVVVRMYLVQPKSLQECHIAFLPPGAVGDMKLSTLSHDSLSKSSFDQSGT